MGRYYVDKYTGRLERTDMYLVRLIKKDGTVVENLEPRRLFPFTNHTMFITLLDSEEKEIALVRDLNELDGDSAKALEECFEDYYMIPQILEILECEDKFGTLKWAVNTDRGKIEFSIRNRHSDIKTLRSSGRVIIRDSNDNRYEIKSVSELDARSKRLLFSYL